ncbi:DUF6602 domain-containing protein [Desulfuribacillus alkaliarsenatis]|uniref:DUF6602 domain-containing protein n=1 Tax=Desulfuribacillus alkaliarsenatis TaxID=766136 RepID=A0A1E5G2M4_9FIRM|nr:DUF6602 domain-containing protein [Desulfuribacillus alkaliarsenatis]OEF97137.1 hypothetical protein BHF68_05950 [Desulfuribacillus alkaliarsenatis]
MDEDKNNAFEKIYKNYKYLNNMMVEEMEIASLHGGVTGNYREEMWIELFRSMIPKKFSMAQGVMIIDSMGKVSKEVDIAVYDEQYTPYVFNYNTLKFIPIEAVAIVIECKSTSYDTENLKGWAKVIDDLTPNPTGIARFATGFSCGITNGTQSRTRPIKIFTAIKGLEKEKTFEDLEKDLSDSFDFIVMQKKQAGQSNFFKLLTPNENKSLGWWGRYLNKGNCDGDKETPLVINGRVRGSEKYEYLKFCSCETSILNKLKVLKVKNNPLLTLNLQLNQLLMLINNPMLFPHIAYANKFNEIAKKITKSENQE